MGEKSLQGCPTAPIFGVQTVSLVTVLAARESDPLAGRNCSLGMSDCQGELSALFRSLKIVGAFALMLCITTNLFAADTASLGEDVVLLAGPWPHVLDSVSGC